MITRDDSKMPQNILEVKIRKLFYVLEMGVSFRMLALLLLSQLISKSLPLTALEFSRKKKPEKNCVLK